jgi:NADH-quinone oxidoreductase subunit L
MFIVAIIGAATAIFAATIGLAQNDIKKVLAYSTVSQLGYMFLACGVGAFVAAIFHVMTHAFFKALLFLGSGSVIHGMHHEQDMRRMGGLKKYMPITCLTMMAGWLAICGIVPFAGFFSKDEILWKTWSTGALGIPLGAGKALWFIGAVTALLTAVYMTRLMVMTFTGGERFRETHAGAHDEHSAAHPSDDDAHAHEAHHGPVEPHESPWVMTVPLIVLAVLATVGGLVGIPYALSSFVGLNVPNYFEQTLEPAVAHAPERGGAAGHEAAAAGQAGEPSLLSREPQQVDGASPLSVGEGQAGEPAQERAPTAAELNQERLFTGISLLIAVFGIGLGYLIFSKSPLRALPRLLEQKYKVDELYDAVIINPIKYVSREGLWKLFDVGVIDGLVNGLARATREVGNAVRRVQFGFVRSYAAIILLGALAVIGYFLYAAVPQLTR